MPIYRVALLLRSSLGTPLAGDTLWGHIAWGVCYREGEAGVAAWLDAYDHGEPPLVISDPLPAGYFPRPRLPRPVTGVETPTRSEAHDFKTIGKRQWVSHNVWSRIASELSAARVFEGISTSSQPESGRHAGTLHAGINRLTGGTDQEGGGLLYAVERTWYAAPARFDVWAHSSGGVEEVRRWFDDGLSGGYGRDGASGLGHIEVEDVQPVDLPPCAGANAVMTLGPLTPAVGDPARGFMSLQTRAGRLGGVFAIGATPSGSTVRQKRPVHALERGSILLTDDPRPWYGRVLRGVHEDPAIRHCGLTIAIPCRLEAAQLAEAM
ncbi:MAG: hypothetical protein KDA21_05100 [Phycisphaerales bacterium]|nr:hypothetical protein [Phycisphaerales bacterium]